MKLGESLIREGKLTKRQLDLALRSQVMVGGHLGTSLIELGYVDEDTLGRALARATGKPLAQPHDFNKIAPRTIEAVPRELAEEYLAIPLSLARKSVQVAMVNPKDLRALDELALATGRTVVPWIAPEVRIMAALERYYGVKRRTRYVALSLSLDEFGKSKQSKRGEVPRSRAEALPVAAADAWQVAAIAPPRIESPAIEATPPKPTVPAPRSSSMSLDELAERYSQATNRDDLARATFEFGAGRAKRMLLMLVRAYRATIWEENGFSLNDKVKREAGFDVTSQSLLRLLMGNDHYCGPLPRDGELERFFDGLRAESPEELLLIPVHVDDHLLAIALLDGGPRGRIQGEVDDFLKAFRLFGTGVGIVALRKRLRGRVLVGALAR